MRFDEHFIARALPDVSIAYGHIPHDPQFSVDSRTIQKGEIFVALSGQNCDGHEFVAEAFKKGAAGCIISAEKQAILKEITSSILKDKLVLIVTDPLDALVKLARAWRVQFDCPVVAITGSVGKTTTKEFLVQI